MKTKVVDYDDIISVHNGEEYEIDEYAKKVAMKNYPDIIQCGDAFDLRNDNWTY